MHFNFHYTFNLTKLFWTPPHLLLKTFWSPPFGNSKLFWPPLHFAQPPPPRYLWTLPKQGLIFIQGLVQISLLIISPTQITMDLHWRTEVRNSMQHTTIRITTCKFWKFHSDDDPWSMNTHTHTHPHHTPHTHTPHTTHTHTHTHPYTKQLWSCTSCLEVTYLQRDGEVYPDSGWEVSPPPQSEAQPLSPWAPNETTLCTSVHGELPNWALLLYSGPPREQPPPLCRPLIFVILVMSLKRWCRSTWCNITL